MFQMLMGNMFAMRQEESVRRAQREEEAMLQQALAMSREDSGHQNPDNMTYEEMLALEESNGGAVSRGLKSF